MTSHLHSAGQNSALAVQITSWEGKAEKQSDKAQQTICSRLRTDALSACAPHVAPAGWGQSSERLAVPTEGDGPSRVCPRWVATFKSCRDIQVTHPFLLTAYVCSPLSALVVISGHSITFQDLTGRQVGERWLGRPGVHAWPSPSGPAGGLSPWPLASACDCHLSVPAHRLPRVGPRCPGSLDQYKACLLSK